MTPTPSSHRRPWPLLAVLLLLHLLPFATRPALVGGDEPHYALMAHSLATDGDLELEDDYAAVATGSMAAGRKAAGKELDRHLRVIAGRAWSIHPIGLPVLAAGPLALLDWLRPGAAPDLWLALMSLAVTFFALLAGRDLLIRWLGDASAGTLLVCALYFSTPLWFYSRTFFTEPYLWALLVLALHGLARGRLTLASALLGATFLVKETALLWILPVVLATLALAGWRRAAALAAGPVVAAGLFMAKNLVLFGHPLVAFQPFQRGDLGAGVVGVLFDQHHGLLPFAPLLALACAGWLVRDPAGGRERRWLLSASLLCASSWLLLTAAWVDWGGGSCYGPRLLLPALPAFAIPLLELWRRYHAQTTFRVIFATLAVAGFTIQLCAALDPVSAFWSIDLPTLLTAKPVNTLLGVAAGIAGFRWLARASKPG